MALENLHKTSNAAWALWKIDEAEQALADEVAPYETVPSHITNLFKRLEFLTGRVVIKELLKSWSLPFYGLTKDEFGKPFLRNYGFQISLSHSYPYVAAIVDQNKSVGIDLEQPKEKLLKIAPRVLDTLELADAGDDIVKHCIYWCAKESLVKIHGKKDLIFAQNLKISPFYRQKQDELIGRIIVNDIETSIPLQYHVYDNFVVVMNK
jgi:4'-phosphopantetheinyl transferase